MHLVPGAPILHSTDLVGWEIVGYVFDKLEGSSAANFEYDAAIGRDEIYSQGSWASSLAYHNGKFYCLGIHTDLVLTLVLIYLQLPTLPVLGR